MTNYAENREILRVITQTAASANSYLTTDADGKGSLVSPGTNEFLITNPSNELTSLGSLFAAIWTTRDTEAIFPVSMGAQTIIGRKSGVDLAQHSFTASTLLGRDAVGDWGNLPMATVRTMLGILGVHKPDDQDKTSDITLADDDDLVLAVSANTDYWVTLMLKVISHVTPDYKFAFDIPSGATLLLSSMFYTDNSTNPACRQYEVAGAAQSETVSGTGANMLHQVLGMVHVGATAGNIAYQWAQNTSDANITRVKADSSMYIVGLTH